MLLGSGPDSAHARRVKLGRCQLEYSHATFRIRPLENPMVRAVQSRSAYYKGVFGKTGAEHPKKSPLCWIGSAVSVQLCGLYSAGLKNTVPADCCERKILFWHDVNSDFVRTRTSQQPAEQARDCDL